MDVVGPQPLDRQPPDPALLRPADRQAAAPYWSVRRVFTSLNT